MQQVQSQAAAAYANNGEDIIQQALAVLAAQLRQPGVTFTSPKASRQFAALKLARQEREVFAVMFLTQQHALIAYEEMFFGTIAQASVYPREIVKMALALNAAAVILVHNHPSGDPEPSAPDETLTKSLKASLQLVDVRVLDHIIVGGLDTVSMAERGIGGLI